jgi:hypothetical protein
MNKVHKPIPKNNFVILDFSVLQGKFWKESSLYSGSGKSLRIRQADHVAPSIRKSWH